MTRTLDLGNSDEPEAGSRLPSCSAATLQWNHRGQMISTRLLGTPIAMFGRASDRDGCLRVCPTSIPENAEKTRQISGLHFLLRYTGDRLQVIDKGSTNGTLLSSRGPLQPNTAVDLQDGDRITVAEVLILAVEFVERAPSPTLDEGVRGEIAAHLEDADWLTQRLVGPSKPGFLDFARLRRVDNLPEEEYVLLFGTGTVGSSGRALITVDADTATRPAVRTLDLGDTTPDYPAAFHWADGVLHLQCCVADQVRINGTAVQAGEDRALTGDATIEVLGQNIQVNVKS